MRYGVNIDKFPRTFKFPYRVRTIDVCKKEYHKSVRSIYLDDHIEFCIRYNSEDAFSDDSIDGKVFNVPFPQMVTKKPFSNHKYTISTPRDAVAFSYSIDVMEKLKADGLLPAAPVFEIRLTPKLNMLLDEVAALIDHTMETNVPDRIDLLCLCILEESMFMYNNLSDNNSAKSTIQSIASYFQRHFTETIDIDALVRRYGMSRCTFYRIWKKHFNCTPAQYLTNLKITWAKDILKSSRQKISSIAETLHFSSTAYFCRKFEMNTGITPAQYRKRFEKKK